MTDKPLDLTPVGTYTGVVKDATIGYSRRSGAGYLRIQLESEDAIPPGYQSTVWAYIHSVALATHPHAYQRLGINLDMTDEKARALVGKRYVFRVTHELYRGDKYVNVRLQQLVS